TAQVVQLPDASIDGGILTLPPTLQRPVVPTDVTGPGGSLGYSRNIRHRILGEDRNTVPDSHHLVVMRDPRYCFTGRWQPFCQQQVAILTPWTINGVQTTVVRQS